MPAHSTSALMLPAHRAPCTYRAERRAAREAEPELSGELGDLPAHLSENTSEVRRALQEQVPEGVAGESDRTAFGLLVRQVHRLRNGQAKAADLASLHRLLGSIGLTPADRPRVSVSLTASERAAVRNNSAAEFFD